jgi:hypothetical protein
MFDPDIGKATRWKKGQASPNPGGRPKSRLLSEALRTRLAEVKRATQQAERTPKSWLRIALKSPVRKARALFTRPAKSLIALKAVHVSKSRLLTLQLSSAADRTRSCSFLSRQQSLAVR